MDIGGGVPTCSAQQLEAHSLPGTWTHSGAPLVQRRACPFEVRRYSCGFLGNETQGAAQPRFKPTGCRLRNFNRNVALAAQVLAGRKLVLIGDCISRQHWMELLCALAVNPGITHSAPAWQPLRGSTVCGQRRCSHVPGERVGLSEQPCYTFATPAAAERPLHVCFLFTARAPDAALLTATRKFRVTADDVILANVGAHGINATHFRAFARLLGASRAVARRPLVLYRTTSPFHDYTAARIDGAVGPRGTLNQRVGLPAQHCDPGVRRWLDSESMRRSYALVRRAGVPVLELGEPLRRRYMDHVEHGDCDHWCQPGPLRFWNDALLTYLAERLGKKGAPRERGLTFTWR